MADIERTTLPHIDPITPQALSEASGLGTMDAASRTLLEAEWRTYLRERRRRGWIWTPKDAAEMPSDLTGIALSGGGIRSATFALGALQALAHHDLLRRFDYLSTVSGGGYIGTSLTWLTSRIALDKAAQAVVNDEGGDKSAPEAASFLRQIPDGFGVERTDAEPEAEPPERPFPYGTDDPRTAKDPERLRPEGAMLRYLRQHGNYLTPGNGITATTILVVVLRGIVLNFLVWLPILAAVMSLFILFSLWMQKPLSTSPPGLLERISPWMEDPKAPLLFFGLLLGLALVIAVLIVAAFAVYSLATYFWPRIPDLLGGYSTYSARRLFETWIRRPLQLIGVLLLVASVPFVGEWAMTSGAISTALGILSGVATFVQTARPAESRAAAAARWSVPTALIASLGAALLLYGLLLVAYAIATWVGAWLVVGDRALLGVPAPYVLGLAVLVAGSTGWFVDLNLITAHRFYRDRLMEAFLPNIDRALVNETDAATHADQIKLSAMCDPSRAVGPYHLINTNLVLTESEERTYRLRGGDSFILSPLYCGSNATGWQPTADYMSNEITLPTAMATSGAAANPWAGSGGVGVTRSLLVSTLMALLNLRLGLWVQNPRREKAASGKLRANHFNPGLIEVLGGNLTERSSVCLLSDGGHFENLALYELIRRRVRLIVLCDAVADPDYGFSDLQNALARVRTDFGARIEFESNTLAPFMPSITAGYPRDAMVSKQAYAVAEITYSDNTEGHLVYLTTTLVEGLRLELMGYKGKNWDFPDQSTGDQFFDEAQFEAYRELGYAIADAAVPKIEELLGALPRTERAAADRAA